MGRRRIMMEEMGTSHTLSWKSYIGGFRCQSHHYLDQQEKLAFSSSPFQARKQDRKVDRVALTISLRGIKVLFSSASASAPPSAQSPLSLSWHRWWRLLLELAPWTSPSTGDDDDDDDFDDDDHCDDDDFLIIMWATKLTIKLLRVSYCSADLTYDHVFAFIVTNRFVVTNRNNFFHHILSIN